MLLLGKVMDRATANQVREVGNISLAEWRVLAHAHILGPCRAAEIASAAFVDRSEVSRAIFSLEERGILKRVPDPKSRRGSLVSLTGEGQELHRLLQESRRRCFERWMSNLDAEERQTIEHGLLKILRNVMAEETGGSVRDPGGPLGD
jgi:DNA-binding MarR family transcriptional regulator